MNISPSILEEFEYTGVWWLPDNPENKVYEPAYHISQNYYENLRLI